MEQHINIRYSLQNFPRHHKKYIDYFLTDYVVEKARVSSEWWNFWEKVWSGEALVHTPSNERNRRHIQSDHYSKYAFQKASRKILNLFPDIYGRYMILFLKKMWLSLLSWETAFFFSKNLFIKKNRQWHMTGQEASFLPNYSWMKKHYTDVHDLFTVQRTSPSAWFASTEQVFMWKHRLLCSVLWPH